MAIDVSSSMLARDLKPNRTGCLKKSRTDFVEARTERPHWDCVYAGEAYTKTPVTSDKGIVVDALEDIKYHDNDCRMEPPSVWDWLQP